MPHDRFFNAALVVVTTLVPQIFRSRHGPAGSPRWIMPGAFHIELLAPPETELKVYLPDSELKNPVTKRCPVEGYMRRKDQRKDRKS